MVRHLLQTAPADALCDFCLAFACGVSPIEMRAITAAILDEDPQHFRRAATCASCRRAVPALMCAK